MDGAISKRSLKPNCFPSASYVDEFLDETGDFGKFDEMADFHKFKQTTVTFLAFGQMIKSIYNESHSYLTTKILLNDICDLNGINDERETTRATPKTMDTNMAKPVGLQPISMESHNGSCSNPITPIEQIFQEILPQYFR